MQFMPDNLEEVGMDADNDGLKDPNDIHDAALAAGYLPVRGGRDLTVAEDSGTPISPTTTVELVRPGRVQRHQRLRPAEPDA